MLDDYGPEELVKAGVPQFIGLIHQLSLHLVALTYELCGGPGFEVGVVERAKMNLFRELSAEEVSEVQLVILAQCAATAERQDANDSLQN